MKMRAVILAAVLSSLAISGSAQDKSGVFDYYVVSLSWSPNWCERTGNARGSQQCDPQNAFGWILHGLWPQYERGWPQYCATEHDDPSREQTAAMADIMGTAGLAAHEWKKHGVCSGFDSVEYFERSRAAFGSITRPDELRDISVASQMPAKRIETAFLLANPHLGADQVTVTCRSGQIQEVRICLTKDLKPRDCGQDVIKDCSLDDALFLPIP